MQYGLDGVNAIGQVDVRVLAAVSCPLLYIRSLQELRYKQGKYSLTEVVQVAGGIGWGESTSNSGLY